MKERATKNMIPRQLSNILNLKHRVDNITLKVLHILRQWRIDELNRNMKGNNKFILLNSLRWK